MLNRIKKLQNYLLENNLDCALITTYENRRYYSGFTGSSGYLIVSKEKTILFTDKRYTLQASSQAKFCTVVEHAINPYESIAKYLNENSLFDIMMELNITMADFKKFENQMPNANIHWENQVFINQRMIKDADEVLAIKSAILCAENALEKLVPKLYIGMSEQDFANELHYLVSLEGAEPMSYGTIVASGARGALAHGVPSEKIIQDGDMVVVDFGVLKDGYCSDITRTFLFGDVSSEHKKWFDLVNESIKLAINSAKPNMKASELEAIHRQPFLRENVNEYTLRNLGHGIGLEIHEMPRISPDNDIVLQEGMVFTIEPGLYFPNICGIRTEDDILVTKTGIEVLSKTPYEIHITKRGSI